MLKLVLNVFLWPDILIILFIFIYFFNWRIIALQCWFLLENNMNQLYIYTYIQASLVTQMVKNLPAVWETWVWSLGREDPLEKEMAIHSSTIAWKIPWTEEPGRLQSTGSQRVGHNWVTSLSFPSLVFLPREFHGQRSLVSYSPWGRKELDTTERLTHTHIHISPLSWTSLLPL